MNPLSSLLNSVGGPARVAFAEAKARLHALPDFLIIGAQRSGTTSLYNYLVDHPAIAPASEKELHFFDLHFGRGLAWYRSQFPPRPAPGRLRWMTGEATPYYVFHPLAPQRIAALLPHVKLILLLRNPIDRAYSHYNSAVKRGIETLSFEDALAQETQRLRGEADRICREPGYISFSHQRLSYLARGTYADQLAVWLRLYPRSQFLIEASETFSRDPSAVLSSTLQFLGLPLWEPQEYRKFNEGSYPPMDTATRRRLRDYFEPQNERLYESLGVSFQWA
jgi:hypothetical protein